MNQPVNQKNITFWTLGVVKALQDLKNTYQGLPSIQITKGKTSIGGIHNDDCDPVLQGGNTNTWSFMVKTSVSFTPSGNKLLAMQLVNGTDLHCEANMKYYPATVSGSHVTNHARTPFALATLLTIAFVDVRVTLFTFQCNALAHSAYTVDGYDNGLAVSIPNILIGMFDKSHGRAPEGGLHTLAVRRKDLKQKKTGPKPCFSCI